MRSVTEYRSFYFSYSCFIFMVCCFLKDVSALHIVFCSCDITTWYYAVLACLCSSVKCLSNSIVGVEVGPKPFVVNCSSNGFAKPLGRRPMASSKINMCLCVYYIYIHECVCVCLCLCFYST
jgi:hypothetical protein